MIAALIFLAGVIGGGLWLVDRRTEARFLEVRARLLGLPKPDLSPVTMRVEELYGRLGALEIIAARLTGMDRAIDRLPKALDGVREEFKRIFEEFEEKALPAESKEVGSQALSRVARARADMERASDESLRDFNEAVEKKQRKADEPIVVRGGL